MFKTICTKKKYSIPTNIKKTILRAPIIYPKGKRAVASAEEAVGGTGLRKGYDEVNAKSFLRGK